MASMDGAARRCRVPHRVGITLLSALAMPAPLLAQTVSIGAGSSWRVGNGTVDLDCAAVQVAGTLDAGDGRIDGAGTVDFSGQLAANAGSIDVGGDWNNHGSFLAGTGTVQFVDRCNAAAGTIRGASTFANLRIESARGKTYRFDAGAQQSVTQSLLLDGGGQHMPIRSTQAGARARLALSLTGTQQIAWVDVADMEAPVNSAWLAQGVPITFNAIDAGNNARWFLSSGLPPAPPVPVPSASQWVLLLLACALAALGSRRFLRR